LAAAIAPNPPKKKVTNETITWRKPAVSGNSPTPMAPSPERQNNAVIRELLNSRQMKYEHDMIRRPKRITEKLKMEAEG
jgi:hypothetical protein